MGDANETRGGWNRYEEVVLQHLDDQKRINESMQETLHSIDTRLSVMESRATQSGGISGGLTGLVVSIVVGIVAYFTGGHDK